MIPHHRLNWTISNYGLHDGTTPLENYTTSMNNITSTILAAVKPFNTTVLYFSTTIPGGSVEPVNASDNVRVRALNKVAAAVMQRQGVPVVDLYATMKACGTDCEACKPHCQPAGYSYLVQHAIAPAVLAALPDGQSGTPSNV